MDVPIETVEINEANELKIVPLYTQYQQYLNASLETEDMEENKRLFKKFVLDYIEEIGEDEKFSTADLKGNFLLTSTSYEQQLLKQIEILIQRHDEITEIIRTTYSDSSQVLPKKKSTVFLAPFNPEFSSVSESMAGVGGAAYKDVFVLYLDADFDKEILAYSTAHEYHHLILYDQPGFNISSVLKSVIVEGKADAFADRIVKDVSPPWNVPMDDATARHIASLVNHYETTFSDFVVGNNQKEIPRWSNYMLGRDMLNHYLASHPHLSIPEWTFKEDHDILEGYKYEALLK
ncbi:MULTISPECIES: DUF2268 domain-containing putative Zn-dependent protease [unclassified Exiguobacterium]|uniref:DUF2268 domain-containing protein n=1 Tax=unclassified Exiguobacterium TaxID=2644629 RepID=UPI001EF06F16|nr:MULTISPECIES: DUF2268 domain-containing putative Zn-dependent protease [unclassified Exiguobacterium]